MNRYLSKYGNILAGILVAAAAAMLSGCINDEHPVFEPPEIETDPQFKLSLTVLSNTAGLTRAETPDHKDDEQEKGTIDENYIDLTGGDFHIAVFDKSGSFMFELGVNDAQTITYSGDKDSPIYKLEYKLDFPDKIEKIREGNLQVMVLANCKSLDKDFTYDSKFGKSDKKTSSVTQVWENNTDFNYNYAVGANSSTWLPQFSPDAQGRRRLIPMFGYAKTGAFTQRNSGEYAASITIPMQRAMAKIEVIDNLHQDGIAVKDVEMTDYNGTGRVIPNVKENPNWNTVGSQVSKSSLPEEVNATKESLKFFYDESDPENKKWIAYVPEMELAKTIADSRTHINVDIQATGFGDLYTGGRYPIHFAKYADNITPTIPDDTWNHILRNHIYRFNINKVGINLELHLHVIPWVLDDDEVWDFTDHVTVEKNLIWTEGTYDNTAGDTNDSEYILLSLARDKWLEGTFKIKTPINGTWHARLVPLDDAKTGAVTFVDEKGDPLQPNEGDPPSCLHISGKIDGEECVIRIRPTNYENDQQSRFRLEFQVENMGRWIDVSMSSGETGYFTIVRPANMIYN